MCTQPKVICSSSPVTGLTLLVEAVHEDRICSGKGRRGDRKKQVSDYERRKKAEEGVRTMKRFFQSPLALANMLIPA
jgi:hypothetical protein